MHSQKEILEEYARRNGFPNPTHFTDKGYSGKNIDRPDFQRLLADIKAGLIKRVVVYKLDRISRSIVSYSRNWNAKASRCV